MKLRLGGLCSVVELAGGECLILPKLLLVPLLQDWIKSHLSNTSSYANPRNTYSHMYKPVLYDYIFHKANGPHLILTDIFKVGSAAEVLPSTAPDISQAPVAG